MGVTIRSGAGGRSGPPLPFGNAPRMARFSPLLAAPARLGTREGWIDTAPGRGAP